MDRPADTACAAGRSEAGALGPRLRRRRAGDAEAARRFAAWRDGLDDAARAALDGATAPDDVRRLLTALAEDSPYLWDLVQASSARLVALLEAEPEARFPALLDAMDARIAVSDDEAETMRALRQAKSEAALLIALCDVGGVWPVMQVTQAMTELADRTLQAAIRWLFRQALAQGRYVLPEGGDAQAPEKTSGYFALAMGKMGAFELNYSSDVDLIVLYDAERPPAPDATPGPFFVRLTQGMVRLLQQRTEDGYVFRVDLRLRPDPGSTAVAISTLAALDYYEGRGRNWERAAMIKARPCAGDLDTGARFLAELSPFVWRRHLDYTALADVHAFKRQMHAFRGHDRIAVAGHNIKLGRGGIREIEFFAQTQQLVAGGRDGRLRTRQTLVALAALAETGWITPAVRDTLISAYEFLRMVEHRVQMVADEQTHSLPEDPAALARIAAFLDFDSLDAFAAELTRHMREVQDCYANLFERNESVPVAALAFPPDADDPATLAALDSLGFRQPREASAMIRRWLSGALRTLTPTAREFLADIVPVLIDELARSEKPDAGLLAFDKFLSGLTNGTRFLSMLRQNRDLVAVLSTILGTAPRLADILAHQPHVADGLVSPSFFTGERVRIDVARIAGESYEDTLDRVRLAGQEHLFRIGTQILSGTLSAQQAGAAFASVADSLVQILHRATEEEFARIYGRIAGARTAVVALGKLGGGEMTAGSDLDLVFIYDYDQASPESDGPRKLYGAQYFSRLMQRLIGALTTQTNYGALYHVDMRLRPSGRAGPLATRIDAFDDYQRNEAWTWEHMALTRARVVSAAPDFADEIARVINAILCLPRDAEVVAEDVSAMRAAIAGEFSDADPWDLKYARGGMVDVEFIAQFLQLAHAAQRPEILDPSTGVVLDRAAAAGLIDVADAEVLRQANRLYQSLTQVMRLCLAEKFDEANPVPGLATLLARAADMPDYSTLGPFLREIEARVREAFVRIVGEVG